MVRNSNLILSYSSNFNGTILGFIGSKNNQVIMENESHNLTRNGTGKSMSEALILESVNPQYDERLFIDFQEKYKFTTCCVQKLFFCFDIQNNICTQHVLNLYFSGNSMNNLLSYCGLTDSRKRASYTDLSVPHFIQNLLDKM